MKMRIPKIVHRAQFWEVINAAHICLFVRIMPTCLFISLSFCQHILVASGESRFHVSDADIFDIPLTLDNQMYVGKPTTPTLNISLFFIQGYSTRHETYSNEIV